MSGQLPISQQWTLHSMQLVNWGCFDGHHKVTLAGGGQVTLITGSTGAGKSTLLDAHTVLMHDARTALNRASNTTTHRARSVETRNIVSYMRGIHGRTRDVDGEHDLTLRAGGLFSAIAETWHSSDGQALTGLSAFYATPEDTTRPQLRRDAWIAGEFDLRWLEEFVQGEHLRAPLPPRALERAFPGLQVMRSTTALHHALWRRLDIGDERAGRNAMALLHKVQAADSVQSVNDLFTTFVLEEPQTFQHAADAHEHFVEMRNSWRQVQVITDQTERLSHIPEQWDRYEQAKGDLALFSQIRLDHPQRRSPFWRWRWERECEVLEAAEAQARQDHQHAQAAQKEAERQERDRQGQWEAAALAVKQDSTLTELSELEVRIAAAETDRDRLEADRAGLAGQVRVVMDLPDTAAQFTHQRAASQEFLAAHPARLAQLEGEVEIVKHRQWELQHQRSQAREERKHFEGRRDVTDRERDTARRRYAELLGMPAEDLPFVGELIDMRPEHEPWRMATEKVLGGTATTLLVPRDRAGEFRRVADVERTRARIPYLQVEEFDAPIREGDPAAVSGRVQYRDHRYSGWLSTLVARRASHLCVDSPDQLTGLPDGYHEAVTRQGQVSHRGGGVVGGQKNHRPTIGFTPQAALDRLDELLAHLEQELGPVDAQLRTAQQRVAELNVAHTAHARFLEVTWDRIDLAGAQTRLDELLQRRQALASNPDSQELIAARDRAREQLEEAQKHAARSADQAQAHQQRWADLVDRKDSAWEALGDLADLPDTHHQRLDELLADFAGREAHSPAVLADFEGTAWRAFTRHLTDRQQEATRHREDARVMLQRTFEDFLRAYPDTQGAEDLTSDPDRSYWDFHAILQGHLATGVDKAREDFTRYVSDLGGVHMLSLLTAYGEERAQIDNRLLEVNKALANQPYDDRGGRVSIVARDGQIPTVVTQFKADLQQAVAGSTEILDYEQALERYGRFERVMTQLENPAERDLLLDVRRHVQLEAQHREGDRLIAYYTGLGAKSGGETQQLTMFIIAAAIRYKIGSQDDTTPRFAPVFMDEGLIKADPERTQRAVQVWTRLGFQPIIATTTDKHESISRTATVMLSISKDHHHRSRIDPIIEITPGTPEPQ